MQIEATMNSRNVVRVERLGDDVDEEVVIRLLSLLGVSA